MPSHIALHEAPILAAAGATRDAERGTGCALAAEIKATVLLGPQSDA
jgi:hypothetical protein